ncbi:hypothetical protein AB0K09_09025 [Streptomyces sp. NPDC049577]|uniref:hypothetical protein n=1 Tax=Streptomyces sp. NPDC049577 TaxID=3155153 RepID=UPI003416C8EA
MSNHELLFRFQAAELTRDAAHLRLLAEAEQARLVREVRSGKGVEEPALRRIGQVLRRRRRHGLAA